jgi:LysR family transcriptional regulator (chromosome initiation inhibitor)
MIETRNAEALLAIVEEGSFEKAARRLHITTPAVSQRIRALEEQFGRVLIERSTPCKVTDSGAVILAYAQQLLLLQQSAMAQLREEGLRATKVSLVVNADSLSTWFMEVIVELSKENVQIEILIEDQDHSIELLRSGRVLGAITSSDKPVQGCRIEELGSMRYEAIANKEFCKRHFPRGVTAEALASAPMLIFNSKDDLQGRFIRSITRRQIEPPVHRLPSALAFIEAARAGMGWGMNPVDFARPYLEDGTVVRLAPRKPLFVPLRWQCWRVETPILSKLSDLVLRSAGKALVVE